MAPHPRQATRRNNRGEFVGLLQRQGLARGGLRLAPLEVLVRDFSQLIDVEEVNATQILNPRVDIAGHRQIDQ